MYPIRSVLIQKDIEKKRVMWQEGTVLDQGSEGACVGFAWTGELLAHPEAPDNQPEQALGNAVALDYYKRAKRIDQWPGEEYEGTSVLAGAKIMQEEGFIAGYRWCFGIEDVRDAVITTGPVVIGIPWKRGMYSTANNGLVQVTGTNVGGHAIVITGYDPAFKVNNKTLEVFRWRNSWGTDYGINGSGYIKYADLESLLAVNGEACVPLVRTKPNFDKFWNKFNNLFLKRLFRNG